MKILTPHRIILSTINLHFESMKYAYLAFNDNEKKEENTCKHKQLVTKS